MFNQSKNVFASIVCALGALISNSGLVFLDGILWHLSKVPMSEVPVMSASTTEEITSSAIGKLTQKPAQHTFHFSVSQLK